MAGKSGLKRPKSCQCSLWTPHEPLKYKPSLESAWHIGFLVVAQVVEEKSEFGFKWMKIANKSNLSPKKWIFKISWNHKIAWYLKQTKVLKRNELHTYKNVYVPWIQIITKLFVQCVIKLFVKPRNYLGQNIPFHSENY